MNGWHSQPAYSLHIYSAVISCECSSVLTAAPMQRRNSKFTHSDEMTASPTSETQKPQKIPPNVPTWQGNRNAVRHPATWEPSETSTRQTHRAWLNTGCVQTHSSAVCVCVSGRSSQADPETWLQLLIKSHSSDLWPLMWDIYWALQISGDRRWGSARALLLYIFWLLTHRTWNK